MEDRNNVRTGTPRRLEVQSSPSLLILEQDPDLRAFLRLSLEQWYQVASMPDGAETIHHLKHHSPQGLVVGRISPQEKEALVSTLQNREAPPVLKLWARYSPSEWADGTLRHPFMRADLIRAVDRLVHAETEKTPLSAPEARPPDLEGEVEAKP